MTVLSSSTLTVTEARLSLADDGLHRIGVFPQARLLRRDSSEVCRERHILRDSGNPSKTLSCEVFKRYRAIPKVETNGFNARSRNTRPIVLIHCHAS